MPKKIDHNERFVKDRVKHALGLRLVLIDLDSRGGELLFSNPQGTRKVSIFISPYSRHPGNDVIVREFIK
jgi:hypothetical protein